LRSLKAMRKRWRWATNPSSSDIYIGSSRTKIMGELKLGNGTLILQAEAPGGS